ncbi:MAG TPA: DUF4178 domain-containing protein [Burkholderiaceae bacterium]|jgi:hypothetical protein
MQKISCPNCGGEVLFRSAASVMAVCEYCQSTLLKDADSVKNIGKMSDLLEDYSPLQITSTGMFQGRNFSLVGRIQLRYDAGIWNEWYVMFDDGEAGWLSDASGQYVFTIIDSSPGESLPAFDNLRPGLPLRYRGATFYASDVRTARCIAGEGELPFKVGNGWELRAADFRVGHRFLTLDYSDAPAPQVYLGQAVTLEQMRCQLLRAEDGVADSAAKFRGKTVPFDCPSCGASIKYMAGMAYHIVCPSCHAEVDCSTDKALVLEKAAELARITTSIDLGDMANINGIKYETIGLMQCQTSYGDESWTWVEYLLFNPAKGFHWLVEGSEGWDSVTVLNEWPDQSGGNITLAGDTYVKSEDYSAVVLYAAGAFNWRISIGDHTRVSEYKKGNRTVTSESNANEVVWSAGRSVPASQVGQWFGKNFGGASASDEPGTESKALFKVARIFTIIIAILNLPMAFIGGMSSFRVIIVALLLLWVPAIIVRFFGKDSNV